MKPWLSALSSRRRASSLAETFSATINYNSPEIIRLAQTDAAAASEAFWKPLNKYRELMSELGVRHARSELHLSLEEFAAKVRAETTEERHSRLDSFRAFTKRLVAAGDHGACAAEQARLEMAAGGAHRQPTRVQIESARGRDDANFDEMGFSVVRCGGAGGNESPRLARPTNTIW